MKLGEFNAILAGIQDSENDVFVKDVLSDFEIMLLPTTITPHTTVGHIAIDWGTKKIYLGR